MSGEVIDLRSDTVTRPSAAMRGAMARAAVGDDVYGEDPSVLELEARACAETGKAAAVFVPSGTMANQLAVRAHTEPGDAVFATPGCHIVCYEGGGAAALSGVHTVLLGEDGAVGPEALREGLDALPDDPHFPRPRLLCLENTHNRAGGRVLPLEPQRELSRTARAAGLAMHLDGARVFNAATASGRSVRELCEPFDSVAFCLSKGLGAPVGSLLCGETAYVRRARRFRKMFGGGMRQAGVLAAAGLFALDHHVKDLAADHERAAVLAEGLRGLASVQRVETPQTNIVRFEVPDAAGWVEAARQRGVWMGAVSRTWVRAVTHRDVDAPALERALGALAGADL